MDNLASNKVSFSGAIILFVILSCLGIAFLNNGIYLLLCLATMYSILLFLWKSNRPGIFVFCFLMQWVQIFAFVLWMNNNGWDINRLSKHGDVAVIEACVCMNLMIIIVARSIRKIPIPTSAELFEKARMINEKKIFFLYLGSTLFLGSIGFALGQTSGFAQILLTLSSVKWIFFLIYGYVTWINKKNRLTLTLMILFEFTTALYSYFSSFKEVILMTIILSFTFIRTVNFRQLFYALLIFLLLIYMALTWTAIKSDFRMFLSHGKRAQVVEVSRDEAFNKMFDEVSNLTWQDYQFSLNIFLYRLQYIFHLSKTMDRVPDVIPYEYGGVWKDNITFVLMPRLFFPDKPIFEATVKTVKYTGLKLAGAKEGTSFSLGYFADSYIDFGYFGMFLPLSMIAFFVSFIYTQIFKFQRLNIIIRYSLVNVAIIDFAFFEADGLFLFGRLTLMFLVTWFLCKTVMPRLQIWLYK